MNLQSLFDAPIIEQTYLDPGYTGHANDVWHVTTTAEVVIVRSFRGRLSLDLSGKAALPFLVSIQAMSLILSRSMLLWRA